MSAANTVPKLYYGVMEEVIANVRDAFMDEGADEQTLAELKQIWEKKLIESKAIEREPDPVVRNVAPPVPTQVVVQPQNAQVASTASVTHQLTMSAPNMLPQAVLQYATTTSDGQKTMLKLPQKLTLTVPANIAQSGLQTLVSASPGATAVQLPAEIASLFQSGQPISGIPFHQFAIPVTTTPQQQQQQVITSSIMGQIDGADDTSDEEDEDDFPDNDDDGEENDDDQIDDDAGEEDEEPLNSDDDVSDEDPSDLFDTENVVVCQYDKITRSKNRWKFHLKDGIMNLQGKDFVFQKALGDSEW